MTPRWSLGASDALLALAFSLLATGKGCALLLRLEPKGDVFGAIVVLMLVGSAGIAISGGSSTLR